MLKNNDTIQSKIKINFSSQNTKTTSHIKTDLIFTMNKILFCLQLCCQTLKLRFKARSHIRDGHFFSSAKFTITLNVAGAIMLNTKCIKYWFKSNRNIVMSTIQWFNKQWFIHGFLISIWYWCCVQYTQEKV